MKTTKISARLSRDFVVPALVAAFSPFGSLTEGVDGQTLAGLMLRWVEASAKEKREMANELIGLVWSATTDQLSTVEVGTWEVSLRTPTSGTRIRLHRYAGGYLVEVDFGANGSESRSMRILEGAERAGVQFDAYCGQERLARETVLTALLKQAEEHLARVQGLESGCYSEEYRAEAVARVQEAVAFFSK